LCRLHGILPHTPDKGEGWLGIATDKHIPQGDKALGRDRPPDATLCLIGGVEEEHAGVSFRLDKIGAVIIHHRKGSLGLDTTACGDITKQSTAMPRLGPPDGAGARSGKGCH
jgi:hypothetical protein